MKRALVLGGGGMYGAFQAGVYKTLYGKIPIHCVVGASAGSLNAWAIAGGMSPADLEDLWMAAGELVRLRLRIPRTLTDSLIDSEFFEAQVGRLVAACRPRMEIGVVVSQGRNLRQVLVRDADVTADVLLASCAVPFLLPARRIGGTLSVDGGLRDACPEWPARDMGATEILAVNVWTHLPWWWIGFRGRRASIPAGVIRIEPPARLGPLRTSAIWNRDRIRSWIEIGRQTAESILARK